MPLWPFRRRTSTSAEQMLSLLSPDEMQALGGIPGEAVAGVFARSSRAAESFRVNAKFVAFMHEVIRTAGPSDRELQDAAREQRDGWLYVIDLRTPEGPHGRVPPEDIIGTFRVRDGRIVAESYSANERHRVFTRSGLVSLPPSLRAAFVSRLRKLQ